MKSILTLFDTFGVPVTLQLDSKKYFFKTHLGGLFTLIIYSLSLIYMVYIFNLRYNQRISPKMFASSTISTFEHLYTDYDVMNIGLYNNNDSKITDPFLEQNNIIMPLLYIVYYNQTTVVKSMLDNKLAEAPLGNGNSFEIKSAINYIHPNGSESGDCDKVILLGKCNPDYLTGNQSCASEEATSAFFKQQNNQMILNINQIILDQENKHSQLIQQYYFSIEESLAYTLNIDLKTTTYAVNYNLFIEEFTRAEYITGSKAYGQSNSMAYGQNTFSQEVYGIIYFTLQSTQGQITIEYPQIGELFASVGSLLSILFLFRYFVYYLNYQLLHRTLIDEIISFYYPQFSNVVIKFNLFHQISQVTYKDQKLDLQQFKSTYEKLRQKAESKITFKNLIYEQSRMFMILRLLKSQPEIRLCHEMGIELNSFVQGSPCQSPSNQSSQFNTFFLDDKDFDLISLEQKKEFLDIIHDEPPISNDTVFRRDQ